MTIKTQLRELNLEVARKARATKKSPSDKVRRDNVPEWWEKMSQAGRLAYLARHPNSKLKNRSTNRVINKLSDKGKKVLADELTKIDKKILPKAADKKLSEEAVKKFPKKVKQDIADDLQEALDTTSKKKAAKKGMSATVKVLAAAGLLVVTSGALLSAGVPIGVFTPHLVRTVWRKMVKQDNETKMVNDFASAIRERLNLGNSNTEDIEDSMVGLKEPKSGKRKKNTPKTESEEGDDN